jgi:hypothetical protein
LVTSPAMERAVYAPREKPKKKISSPLTFGSEPLGS